MYKNLDIDLSPEMAAAFMDFFTLPDAVRRVAFVKHALIDIHPSTEVGTLIPILNKLSASLSLRTLSFTPKSYISSRTYAIVDICFMRKLAHLSTMLVPAYYDGDSLNIPNDQPDYPHDLYTFFEPRTAAQVQEIEKYSTLAEKRNRAKRLTQRTYWPHIKKNTGAMDLVIKLRKNSNSGPDSAQEIDIMLAPYTPAALSRKLIAMKNGREVVELSTLHEYNTPPILELPASACCQRSPKKFHVTLLSLR